MAHYNPIELSVIFKSCKNSEEVVKSCAALSHLISNYDHPYKEFIKKISLVRIAEVPE